MAAPYRGGPPAPDDEPAPKFRDELTVAEELVSLGVAALGVGGLGFAAFGSVGAAAAAAAICVTPGAAAAFLGRPLQRAFVRRRAQRVAREVVRLERVVAERESLRK